jgi:hypothetical protein
MRKRLKEKQRALGRPTQLPSESSGQQLSPEGQERASLGRILSEMGYRGSGKDGRYAPRNRR